MLHHPHEKPHPGVETKRKSLSYRLEEGHVFRKLNRKNCVFIEYAPLETAWVPIVGENYLYIYCLWVQGGANGKGYGRKLMKDCLQQAKKEGKSVVCMLGQKTKGPAFRSILCQKIWVLRRGYHAGRL